MPGPKPGALPLGDAPTRHLTIIEYQAEMSSLNYVSKKVGFLSDFFKVIGRNLFYAVALSVTFQIKSPKAAIAAPANANFEPPLIVNLGNGLLNA